MVVAEGSLLPPKRVGVVTKMGTFLVCFEQLGLARVGLNSAFLRNAWTLEALAKEDQVQRVAGSVLASEFICSYDGLVNVCRSPSLADGGCYYRVLIHELIG